MEKYEKYLYLHKFSSTFFQKRDSHFNRIIGRLFEH